MLGCLGEQCSEAKRPAKGSNPFILSCKKKSTSFYEMLFFLACLKGFEPPANGLEVRCSIQLSYKHIYLVNCSSMERVMGIGPTQSAWKADVLPLNYTRISYVERADLKYYTDLNPICQHHLML